MQINPTAIVVISLILLVRCSLDGGNAVAAATVKFKNASQTESSDFESPLKQPVSNDAPVEQIENDKIRGSPLSVGASTETEVKFDSPTKVISNDYELEFRNVSSNNVLPNSLIRKIISILGKRQPASGTGTGTAPSLSVVSPLSSDPNKQLFGGRLPPFIERIIQRIQNYFSVYNPPEYFDSNRPPPSSATQHSGITLICSNSSSGSVSCNEMNSSEEQEEQEQGETLEVCGGSEPSQPEENSGNQPDNSEAGSQSQDEYNVVVTHTVVQDSSLNVYSPVQTSISGTIDTATDSTQMVSNVVVILEPAAGQYSPPSLNNVDRNKFYVYVNPTSANRNQQQQQQQQLKTWNESISGDSNKVENFQPYLNTTYTVIIRGDKLQEYNTNLQDADNYTLNPEIAIYVRNSTKKSKKCKLPSGPTEAAATVNVQDSECEQNAPAPLTSRSIANNYSRSDQYNETITQKTKNNDISNNNKVPNINLMLVPPAKNKPCASKNKVTKNPQLEYYILKPDNGGTGGSPTKGKAQNKGKSMYYLQKTSIGSAPLSPTYLPPLSLSPNP